MAERKSKYATLGNTPEQGQSKKAWIFEVDKLKKIDPRQYFVTTGEATVKIKVLIEDLKESLKNAKKLEKEFADTKGESDYLETCWEDKKLILKKKEKRSRAKKEEPKIKAKTGKKDEKSK